MSTQYPQISFTPGGQLYTYINDEPDDVAVGDFVEVQGRYGPQVREVVALADSPPPGITLKSCTKV